MLSTMGSRSGAHRRSIRVRLADRPGSLHRLTKVVADAGVNIIRLEIVSLEQAEVWDDIELSASSHDRLDTVIRSLRDSGLTVIGLPASWVIRDWAVEVLRTLEGLADSTDVLDALRRFAKATAALTQTVHAFVLMEPQPPIPELAMSRWELLRQAATEFDPDIVEWTGEPGLVKLVAAAMRAARGDDGDATEPGAVGAAVRIPSPGGRPATLAVVGHRPRFLPAETSRLELFARVAAPHIVSSRWEAFA
jgi:ACT domain-containing protein